MTSEPLLCGICPTCNRPELLAQMLDRFENQTYENRFLVILDDLGQYNNQSGDRWELISIPRRILSLGEKNNCVAAMVPRDTYGLVKMDDDDAYAPWHFEAMAEALTRGEFVQPRVVVDYWEDEWVQVEAFSQDDPTHFCYHSSWGYTRELFNAIGGYRCRYAGDDGEFQRRMLQHGVTSVGFAESYLPSLWYNRPLANRISEVGDGEEAYFAAGADAEFVGDLVLTRMYSFFPVITPNEWQLHTPTKRIKRPW